MAARSRRTALWLSLVATFCLPGSAHADLFIFTGALTLEIDFPGFEFPPLGVPGGGIATVNGGGPTFHQLAVPAGAFGTVLSVPLPNNFPIVNLVLSLQNQAMAFASDGPACATPHPNVTCSGAGSLHGRSGIAGSMFVGLFGTNTEPFANLTVPIGPIGAGSTSLVGSPLGITVRVSGAGWTNGTATVLAPERETTQMRTGGTATTAGGRRTLSLVSPVSIYSNGTTQVFTSFLVLELRLVKRFPEPGSGLLLATAGAALVVRGLVLRRRHSR